MAIAGVSEPVVRSRKSVEALKSDVSEITGEIRVLSENHRSSSNETVNQGLLRHDSGTNTSYSRLFMAFALGGNGERNEGAVEEERKPKRRMESMAERGVE